MTADLTLVVFDVDGTLVDSQADILGAMTHAFSRAGRPVPSRQEVLSIVGLSLDVAMARLAPDLPTEMHEAMVGWYKDAYMTLRAEKGAAQSSPLYPFVREALSHLHRVPETLLGVATGKSRRGLDKLLQAHDLGSYFVTQQVSDHHPSKPHPSMLLAALAETGVAPERAVMVGDTSFDRDMAQAAGIAFIGVSWGYHPRNALHGAITILDDMRDLPDAVAHLWEAST